MSKLADATQFDPRLIFSKTEFSPEVVGSMGDAYDAAAKLLGEKGMVDRATAEEAARKSWNWRAWGNSTFKP